METFYCSSLDPWKQNRALVLQHFINNWGLIKTRCQVVRWACLGGSLLLLGAQQGSVVLWVSYANLLIETFYLMATNKVHKVEKMCDRQTDKHCQQHVISAQLIILIDMSWHIYCDIQQWIIQNLCQDSLYIILSQLKWYIQMNCCSVLAPCLTKFRE